jgi:hypothetical protein
MTTRLAFGLILLGCSAGAFAQEGNYMMPVQRPKAATAAAGAQGPVLKAGTEVALKISDSAKSQKLGVGQRVPLVVASDVRLGTAVVIPAGTTGEGEVTTLQGKNVAAKALYVRLNGKLVRLSGDLAKATLGEDVKAN